MKDFKERFTRPFENGLIWLNDYGTEDVIRVESEILTGWHPCNWALGTKLRMTDETKRFLVVTIHFPESYKQKVPEWREPATPIPQACVSILYSMGLGCLVGDAVIHPRRGYFRFWTEVNERVYRNLPPLVAPVKWDEAMPQSPYTQEDDPND